MAIEMSRLDRHADNGKGRFRGEHTGQMCGATGGSNENTSTATCSALAQLYHAMRRSVCGGDRKVIGNTEFFEDVECGFENREIC